MVIRIGDSYVKNYPPPELVQILVHVYAIGLDKVGNVKITGRIISYDFFIFAGHGHRRRKMNSFMLVSVKSFCKKSMMPAFYFIYPAWRHDYTGFQG